MFWRKKKTDRQDAANNAPQNNRQNKQADQPSIAGFNQKILIVVATTLALLLVWTLRNVVLLAFGAVLVSIIISGITGFIQRITHMRRSFCLTLAVLIIVAVIALFSWWMGGEIQEQAKRIIDQMPAAWDSIRARFADMTIGHFIEDHYSSFSGTGGNMVSGIAGTTATFAGSIANLVLMLFSGLFLAAQPKLYRAGFLKLFPRNRQDQAAETLDHCHFALKSWLVGKLVSMTIVAVFIALGLWLVGLPSPLAFGLLAGTGEFVPFIGSITTMIPALLIAFIMGGNNILWTIGVYLGVYLGVQQVQSNIIAPLITREMVNIPGAVTLLGIASFGVLFGITGILFAEPLTVLIFTLVQKLYVRDALGQSIDLISEKASQ